MMVKFVGCRSMRSLLMERNKPVAMVTVTDREGASVC